MRIFLTILISVFLLFTACSNTSGTTENKDDASTGDVENTDDVADEVDLVDTEDNQDTGDTVDENTDEVADEDVDDAPPLEVVEFDDPDSQYNENPIAVIVTIEEMRPVFEDLASLHSFYGIPTVVQTVEKICETAVCDDEDTKNDTAKAIKDYLINFPGLKYFVIGGDIEVVPSRKVHDKYSNIAAGTFEGDFQTDFYFADLGMWDTNNNGIYAEDNDNLDYMAEIAVGRVPVSTVEEAENYLGKVIHHMTNYDPMHVKKSLLLANVATNFSGVDINAGYYFETEGRTRDIIPMDFLKRKIYTKTFPKPANDAEDLNNQVMEQALEEGVNIVVHNGHGYPTLLSCEQSNNDNNFTAEMAYALENTTYPIFLSCACQAGQFEAPFEYTYENYAGEIITKVFEDDSGGEQYITAPKGGGIIYLGNTTTGLGLAGGSQFIDEMLRSMFMFPSSIIGDSYLFAHGALKQNDTFAPPIPAVPAVPVVDPDSWRWTKKSIVMLGDPLLTFWRDVFPKIEGSVSAVAEKVQDGYRLRINISSELEGETLGIFTAGKFYTMPAVLTGQNILNVEGEVSSVNISVYRNDHQLFFEKIEL